MISHISGKLEKFKETSVILNVGGIFYEIFIPVSIMKTIEERVDVSGNVRFVTYHYYHLEPSKSFPILIGFLNEVEKEFFEQFITVSGVGPKAAVKALAVPIPAIAKAIDEADISTLKSLPGIGTQRAKEIVAKLQGKVGKFGLIQDRGVAPAAGTAKANFQNEALEVLLQLQYKKNEAENMIQKALERAPQIETAEELLNEVYRQRSN